MIGESIYTQGEKRRPRVQTWCARKRTLTSPELRRDGKNSNPQAHLILRIIIWVSAISSLLLSFCRTLKSGINQIPNTKNRERRFRGGILTINAKKTAVRRRY